MDPDSRAAQLGEGSLLEGHLERRKPNGEELDQVAIPRVARRHEPQPLWRTAEEEAIHEVLVFRDEDSRFGIGNHAETRIRGAVAVREVERMGSIMTDIGEDPCESTRELCVEQEPQAAFGSTCFVRLNRAA